MRRNGFPLHPVYNQSMRYVRVAVNIPAVEGLFDYDLPAELASQVGVGCLVTVPFAKQTVQGVVVELLATPAVPETKSVLDLLDSHPVMTAAQLALAHTLSERFLAPQAAYIELMLPSGLAQRADILYRLEEADQRPESGLARNLPNSPLTTSQSRLIGLLQKRGPLRGRQIDRALSRLEWRKGAERLIRAGIITRQFVLPPPGVRPKYVRTAQLAVPLEQAEAAMPSLGRSAISLQRRQVALRFLMNELDEVNVSWVYAESGCKLADLQVLAESGLIALRESEVWRDPLAKIEVLSGTPPELTADQQRVWNEISAAFQQQVAGISAKPILLHGVTGSGKTELYIRATAEAIRRGKQAIILVPEIALTPQTVRRFLARFPGQVGLLHSRLSPGERYDTWRRARAGLLKVMIGPRSALFIPFSDVGFIAVDECHDGSYYQSEPPFYNAVLAAQMFARHSGAVCVLGSATPSVEQRFQAEVGESSYLELPDRIPQSQASKFEHGLPPVEVIDMRAELKAGNRGIFSRALVDALGQTLQRDEQAILFLNRRGTASYVFCRQCGYTLKCPQCEMPLTYHLERVNVHTLVRSSHPLLLCHRCGYSRQKPPTCPACGSDQIREYGLGSEKVEAEVQAQFPQARTLRWDWETTRQKDAHEIILSHFAAQRADVLVGTQMLAKGLDLPLVTLVGVVLADVGLNLPDPFSAERTFDVLTQVAGRAGRSARGGQVIMQTFQPEHYAIQAATRHDYAGFYTRELHERRRLGYPPFARLVRMEYRHFDAHKAESEARQMAEKINEWLVAGNRKQTTIIGPVPSFFARLGGLYRWQIVLRGPEPESLLQGHAFEGWRVEVQPASLL